MLLWFLKLICRDARTDITRETVEEGFRAVRKVFLHNFSLLLPTPSSKTYPKFKCKQRSCQGRFFVLPLPDFSVITSDLLVDALSLSAAPSRPFFDRCSCLGNLWLPSQRQVFIRNESLLGVRVCSSTSLSPSIVPLWTDGSRVARVAT